MVRLSNHQVALCLMLVSAFLVGGGCSFYKTPGGGADFAIFADQDIKTILDRRPVSPLPANLAVVRVQEPHYRSYTAEGYGQGRFSVVTVRDIEEEKDFDRVANLPEVSQVVPLNRLLLSDRLDSDRQLRQAAASLHADMLLVYTFDTDFFVGDALRPLTVVTLGLSPNKRVRVTTTASAILVDVRTGHVYGSCETTTRKEQLASAWTSSDTVDHSRLKTERQAFENLLDEFERLWRTVLSERRKGASGQPLQPTHVKQGNADIPS